MPTPPGHRGSSCSTSLQQPSGGFGAAQDSESWIDGERSEGGYYARDAAARAATRTPGRRRQGRDGLERPGDRRARARGRPPRRARAGSTPHGGRRMRCSEQRRSDGRLVRASLDEIPSTAAATLADYGQLADGLAALAAATGEVAYAERARELVAACVRSDGVVATPGGGDPVLAAQRIGAPDAASDGDEPSGSSSLADAAAALWQLGAGDEFRRSPPDSWVVTPRMPSPSRSPTGRCCGWALARRPAAAAGRGDRRPRRAAGRRRAGDHRRRVRRRRPGPGRGVQQPRLRAVRGQVDDRRTSRRRSNARRSPAGCRSRGWIS